MTQPDRFVDQVPTYTNARNLLRGDEGIETQIVERVAKLPEDNSRHFARESFQLGAGYAYIVRERPSHDDEPLFGDGSSHDNTGEAIISPSLVKAFFNTVPHNRHVPITEFNRHQSTMSKLAAQALCGEVFAPLHPSIDPYQFEALLAFIDGYRFVAEHQHLSGVLSPRSTLSYSGDSL